MKIELTKQGPTFWMLGEPPNLHVHLSTFDPGPEEVDFSSLEPKFQKYVLISLKSGHIKTDIPFEELRAKTNFIEEIAQNMAERIEQDKTDQLEKEFDFFEKQKKKREKELKRIVFLLERTLTGIRNALKKEKDSRFVRLLLQYERSGKNRKTVVKHLEHKIETMEQAFVRKVNKSFLPSPPKETSTFDVVESDEELIEISTEVLAAIAAGVY